MPTASSAEPLPWRRAAPRNDANRRARVPDFTPPQLRVSRCQGHARLSQRAGEGASGLWNPRVWKEASKLQAP